MVDVSNGVFAAHSTEIDRWVQIGVASGKLIKVDFLQEQPDTRVTDHPILHRLLAVLRGEQTDLFHDVTLGLTVGQDHRAIFSTVRAIEPGSELTGKEVARRTTGLDHDETGEQQVRAALEANPVPLVVPDHRVSDIAGSTPGPVRSHLRAVEGLD